MRLRRIEKASRGESIHKKVVAKAARLATVVGVEIVVIDGGAAKVDVAMPAKIGPGAGRNIQHSPETVAIFGGETTGHQVHRLEDLRANAGAELRLGIVQKGNSVDELMQGKFGSTNRQKIVVAVARSGHQIVDHDCWYCRSAGRAASQGPVV